LKQQALVRALRRIGCRRGYGRVMRQTSKINVSFGRLITEYHRSTHTDVVSVMC